MNIKKIPISGPEPLALLRIILSITLIVQVVRSYDYFELLYSVDVFHKLSNYSSPYWSVISNEFNIYSLLQEGDNFEILIIIYVFSLTSLLFGFKTKLSAFISLLLFTVIKNSSFISAYGAYDFAVIGLFYCLILPVGHAYSIDSIKNNYFDSSIYTISKYILMGQMSIVYVSASIEKASGIEWFNGESVWRTFARPSAIGQDFIFMYDFPIILSIIGIIVMLIQASYPLLLINKSTRKINLILVEFMHFSIAIALDLWIFSALMLAINLGALVDCRSLKKLILI